MYVCIIIIICIFSPLLKLVKINPGTVFIIITVATVCCMRL